MNNEKFLNFENKALDQNPGNAFEVSMRWKINGKNRCKNCNRTARCQLGEMICDRQTCGNNIVFLDLHQLEQCSSIYRSTFATLAHRVPNLNNGS